MIQMPRYTINILEAERDKREENLAIGLAFLVGLFGAAALVAQDVVSAVSGTVTKVDSATKRSSLSRQTERSIRLLRLERTTVQGADASARGREGRFHG